MQVEPFFDPATFTWTYVVYDEGDALIIDPVLDFDFATGQISHESFERLQNFIESKGLEVHWVLETHVHADHLSASGLIKQVWPEVQVGISHRICEVQERFQSVFGMKKPSQGQQFDRLFKHGDTLQVGHLCLVTLETPGHTPACMSYHINNEAVFTGDVLFLPDSGTGRCDFPGGSAQVLYDSVCDVLYQLDDQCVLYVGHDYQPGGREPQCQSRIGVQKRTNIFLPSSLSKDDFVKKREERDRGLAAPKLLLPSLQVNMNAGCFPFQEGSEIYLKIPLQVPHEIKTLEQVS